MTINRKWEFELGEKIAKLIETYGIEVPDLEKINFLLEDLVKDQKAKK
jgi:hypothetical protein